MDTPLNDAINKGYFDIAEELVKAGADVHIKDSIFEMTPLDRLKLSHPNSAITKLIQEKVNNGQGMHKNKMTTPVNRRLMATDNNSSSISLREKRERRKRDIDAKNRSLLGLR